MPRWKTTEQIINPLKNEEYFDENWMNYSRLYQYCPKPIFWNGSRLIRFEDIDVWEIISESSDHSGITGVYAAWIPYAEYYIVVKNWNIIAEFEEPQANNKLEKFLIKNKIHY